MESVSNFNWSDVMIFLVIFFQKINQVQKNSYTLWPASSQCDVICATMNSFWRFRMPKSTIRRCMTRLATLFVVTENLSKPTQSMIIFDGTPIQITTSSPHFPSVLGSQEQKDQNVKNVFLNFSLQIILMILDVNFAVKWWKVNIRYQLTCPSTKRWMRSDSRVAYVTKPSFQITIWKSIQKLTSKRSKRNFHVRNVANGKNL